MGLLHDNQQHLMASNRNNEFIQKNQHVNVKGCYVP